MAKEIGNLLINEVYYEVAIEEMVGASKTGQLDGETPNLWKQEKKKRVRVRKRYMIVWLILTAC